MSDDQLAGNPAIAAAVLFDYGGVLTSSVLEAFRDLGRLECDDPGLPLRLLSRDPVSSSLLRDLEENRITDTVFEAGFANRLSDFGPTVEPRGLLGRIHERISPNEQMLGLVSTIRAAGFPVGLLSNSMGNDTYARRDLVGLFDSMTISGTEGVRKPSRRIYEIACSRLGFSAPQVVFVDDLEQNITAASRLGITGIVHRDAESTAAALEAHLGLAVGALSTQLAGPVR